MVFISIQIKSKTMNTFLIIPSWFILYKNKLTLFTLSTTEVTEYKIGIYIAKDIKTLGHIFFLNPEIKMLE